MNEATKKGYTVAETGDSINVAHPDSKTRRGRVGKQIANTLVASGIEQAVVDVKGVTFNRKDGIKEDGDIAHSLSASDWRGLNRNQNQTAVFESKEVRPVITPDRVNKRQNGRRFKEDGEEMFTLTAQDCHGVMKSYFECMVDDTQGFDGARLYKKYSPTLRSERDGLKILESLPMECEIPQEPKIEVVGSLEGSHESGNRVYSKNGLAPTIAARDYKGPKMIADEIIEVGKLNMKGHRSVRAVHSPYGQCPTLTTMGGGHREPKTVEYVGKQHRIRKLMPLECWRLQGFTDEQHNAVERAGISNSQRYKQAGNAVSVPVVREVARRMLEYIERR